jgi:hypothetical protein
LAQWWRLWGARCLYGTGDSGLGQADRRGPVRELGGFAGVDDVTDRLQARLAFGLGDAQICR